MDLQVTQQHPIQHFLLSLTPLFLTLSILFQFTKQIFTLMSNMPGIVLQQLFGFQVEVPALTINSLAIEVVPRCYFQELSQTLLSLTLEFHCQFLMGLLLLCDKYNPIRSIDQIDRDIKLNLNKNNIIFQGYGYN